MKLSLLICIFCFLSSVARTQPNSPSALKDIGVDQRLGEQVPLNLTFYDEAGKTVKLADLMEDRPAVLALVYYQCTMLCPMVMNGMERCLQGLSLDIGRDYDVIIVSFDPHDTPAEATAQKQTYLKDYRRAGAAEGCHFLTGDETNIRKLAETVGFRYTYDPQTKQYAHAAAIMVLTPAGKLAQYFYGIEYPARDVRLALVQASNGKIGTLVDQILLYCCHYDPIRGKYGFVITRVIRLAGTATVVVLGGFVGLMLWREKRRKSA
jgi:protein SCO1